MSVIYDRENFYLLCITAKTDIDVKQCLQQVVLIKQPGQLDINNKLKSAWQHNDVYVYTHIHIHVFQTVNCNLCSILTILKETFEQLKYIQLSQSFKLTTTVTELLPLLKLKPFLFFCSYLVSTGGDVRGQSLDLTVEDVVLLHLVLHRWQVLSKAFIVQIGLVRETKKYVLVHPTMCWYVWT